MSDNLFDWRPKSALEWVILLAGTGIMLTSPMGAKFLTTELYRYITDKHKDKYDEPIRIKITTNSLTQVIYRLKRRQLIKMEEIEGRTVITLTEKGKGKRLTCNLDSLTIQQPAVWDGKWRLLIFDIPELKRGGRDRFRSKLKNMKFLQFQKSVWIYPYPCEKEIDFLAEALRVREHLTFLTVQIEDDVPLKEKFLLSP